MVWDTCHIAGVEGSTEMSSQGLVQGVLYFNTQPSFLTPPLPNTLSAVASPCTSPASALPAAPPLTTQLPAHGHPGLFLLSKAFTSTSPTSLHSSLLRITAWTPSRVFDSHPTVFRGHRVTILLVFTLHLCVASPSKTVESAKKQDPVAPREHSRCSIKCPSWK